MWTKQEIGQVIKESRLSAGLTQKQVAEALERPQQTIASWESGKSQPDANTLFILFQVLGRSVDEAFGFSLKEKNSPGVAETAPGEEKLINLYRELNEEGRDKLIDYADDLVSYRKYIKSNPAKLGGEKLA